MRHLHTTRLSYMRRGSIEWDATLSTLSLLTGGDLRGWAYMATANLNGRWHHVFRHRDLPAGVLPYQSGRVILKIKASHEWAPGRRMPCAA